MGNRMQNILSGADVAERPEPVWHIRAECLRGCFRTGMHVDLPEQRGHDGSAVQESTRYAASQQFGGDKSGQ